MNRKMKKNIAIIIQDITKQGGTERATVNLANLLCSEYNVCIISIYKGVSDVPAFFVDSTVSLYFFDYEFDVSIKRFFNYTKLSKCVRKFCQENKIELLISTSHAISFLLPYICLKTNIYSIATEHMARTAFPLFSQVLQRISYPFLDALVVLSKSAAKQYPFMKRMYIIPNSLPFHSNEKALLDTNTLMSVGRLSPEKGFDRLIKLAVILRKNTNISQIRIFGDGDLRQELQTQIEMAGLTDFVVLCGASNQIEKEYFNADIYLMTSYTEAFPMVLLEAQACGLPVVAFDCKEGPREIITDGVNGFLIEDGNVELFAQKVSELMSNYERRISMGAMGQEMSKSYMPITIMSQWNNLFKKLLK